MANLMLIVVAFLASSPLLAADPARIDWPKVPARTVVLFYPGQSSYQWLRGTQHAGAKQTDTTACITCHRGQEKTLGEKIVKGGPLEPTPVKGKNGSVDLQVQAAYDTKHVYMRFEWRTANAHPGTEHQYLRYDGKAWQVYGQPKLDRAVREGTMPAIYEDRLAMMIDDGKVPRFADQGCWLACHNGQRDMPNAATREQAQADPLLAALKRNDLRKFLPSTRTDPMNWRSGRSQTEIAKIKASGAFLDLIQWRAHRSHPVGMTDDGYVLEYRLFDDGENVFSTNRDSQTKAPKWMWDGKKTGYRSIDASRLRKDDHFLIQEQNAVPFDPAAGWKAGDMIPYYVTSRTNASGSAADNRASAEWKGGKWTVVIVRPLALGNADDKALRPGGVYNVAFSVHDDNITTRGHHVSFTRTLGMGVKADIEAVKLP